MARKTVTVTVPTTFVGTFYDKETGVYVATRKDGSITTGRIGQRGLNVRLGVVFPNADPMTRVEH